MQDIVDEVQQLIIQFIIKTGKLKDIDRPNDIIEALNYDAIEDIKDRLYDLVMDEIDIYAMHTEIQKHQVYDTDSDDDEEKKSCENNEDDEDDN
jgi:hypothetical protein